MTERERKAVDDLLWYVDQLERLVYPADDSGEHETVAAVRKLLEEPAFIPGCDPYIYPLPPPPTPCSACEREARSQVTIHCSPHTCGPSGRETT